jgi:TrmH family RNA methyltransferase
VVALCRYHEATIDFKKAKRIFLLDGLQDPGNIGTIIRTSLAFGFDGVMLSSDSVDLYNDKLLRACQGANYYLPVMQKDILESIQLLHDNGFKVYATSLRNAKAIDEFGVEEKMAFILGNEGNGVKDSTIDACDGAIYIPISQAESLNVAIAGGIVAFNFKK